MDHICTQEIHRAGRRNADTACPAKASAVPVVYNARNLMQVLFLRECHLFIQAAAPRSICPNQGFLQQLDVTNQCLVSTQFFPLPTSTIRGTESDAACSISYFTSPVTTSSS